MNILKLTDKPSELEAVKDKVVEELQYLRSLDTAGDGGDFGRPRPREFCCTRREAQSVNIKLCSPLLPCYLCFSVL